MTPELYKKLRLISGQMPHTIKLLQEIIADGDTSETERLFNKRLIEALTEIRTMIKSGIALYGFDAIDRLAFKSKKFPKGVVKDAISRCANGESLVSLSKELNVSRASFSDWLETAGVKAHGKAGCPARVFSEEEKDLAIKLYKFGRSVSEIRIALHCSRETLLRAFEEWGVVPKKSGGFQKEEKPEPEAVEQLQPGVRGRIHLMETKKKRSDSLLDPVFLNIPKRPMEEVSKKAAGPAIKRRTVNFDHPED